MTATPTKAEAAQLAHYARRELLRQHNTLCGPDGLPFEMRGACAELLSCQNHQVVLAGPADTGKTFASCMKLHALCLNNPGVQAAMVRKFNAAMAGSVCVTFDKVARAGGVQLEVVGGKSPSRYIYRNGSTVWVGGMDNPTKVLSTERDYIYVNQAEELTLNDWETLATRCTGRGSVGQYQQLWGDCNPSGRLHWIKQREKAGTLRLLDARHEDNPTIYDKHGALTAKGKERLEALASLTGVRRSRLYQGLWVTAEGAVYDTFDQNVHVRSYARANYRVFKLAVDEGYTNPAVILDVGVDGDGRWHLFREYYEVGKLQAAVVAQAKEWTSEHAVEAVAVDESAAGLIADLVDAGVPARGFKGRVLDGIQRVQDRLKVQGDGRPRLTLDPGCVNTVNEFESYSWKTGHDMPQKEHDHAMDALRYLATMEGEPTGAFDVRSIAKAHTAPRQPEYTRLETDGANRLRSGDYG